MTTLWKILVAIAAIALAYLIWHLIPGDPAPVSDGMEAVFL